MRICEIESGDCADLIVLGDEANLSPWTAQNYVDEMRNPLSVMLKAVGDANEIVGFVVGRVVTAADVPDRFDAEIYNIAVAREHRRSGSGQILFDAFLERASKHRARAIWLEVRASNEAAIAFYKANGFFTVSTRPNFYSNPREDALLMRRNLSEAD